MSRINSPGGLRGAQPEAMEEDVHAHAQPLPQQQAPSQSQQYEGSSTPQAARRAPRAPNSPSASQQPGVSQQGTPAPARRPQPQPSGSFMQGGSLLQSEGTLGGGATPLPRGLAQNRGEFGGAAQRRPNVRIGTAGRPARTMSVSQASGDQQQEDGVAPAEGDELPPVHDGTADDGTYVWGTNINSRHLRQQIDGFIRTFRPVGADPTAPAKYVQIIKEAIEAGETSINIDTADMRAVINGLSYSDLYETLVDFPREVHCVLDEVVREVAVLDLNFEPELENRQQAMDLCLLVCRPYNLAATKHIRDLDPSDIDKLVCIKGMVTRTSAIIPNLRYAVFECAACGHEVATPNVNGRVEDPTSCPACKKKWSMVLQHNKGSYTDKQLVKMQESPNDIPEGETPMGVTLYTYDTLVDVARPGDRVTITGMYRAAPIRANPRQAALHALFRTYVDVIHIHRDETRRLFTQAAGQDGKAVDAEPTILSAPNTPADSQQVGGDLPPQSLTDPVGTEDQLVAIENITAEELQEVEGKIKELSRDPRLVERLVASLAPNIWEMEDVKKGVLCLLFGGTPKIFPGGKIRSELNVLLVGDPSVSKSQLLTYVHQLAPRGIYTSGKGSSAVGLTAYVTKDPETKEMVLESGALVLSDRGVCCIDEFDKMSDSARSMLHEAMEQQTVSVAKAGLISTLNARCSVLACANPVGSRYNPQMSIAENINLPPTLLTRFDLIYLVLDRYEEARDRRLARHLVSLFHPGAQNRSRAGSAANSLELISPDLLKKYIAYARAKCQPKLTDEAAEELVNRYQTLRRDGRERKVVMATPRQLESLIRISESLARMRLDERIRAADVAEAVRLWYGAMAGSAGSSDGRPDLDTLYCGTTAAQRAAAKALPEELRTVISGLRMSHTLSVDDLLREINSRMAATGQQQQQGGVATTGGVSRSMLITALRMLDDVVLYDETTNTVRPILRGREENRPQAQKEAARTAGNTPPVFAS